MMHYLIPIMDTGNRVIITCQQPTSKMYPFNEQMPCLMPIANKTNLERILDIVGKTNNEIILIGMDSPQLIEITDMYHCSFYKTTGNLFLDIIECSKDSGYVTIISAEGAYYENELLDFISLSKTGHNYVMLCKLKDKDRSIDYICANASKQIFSFMAHAREHYVNARSCKAYVLNRNVLDLFVYVGSGFNNINCGQMPPHDVLLIENVIQKAIEKEIVINSYFVNHFASLEFAWDIRRLNEEYCKNVVSCLSENSIDKSASIDTSCIIKGNVIVGKNCIIQHNVIIEGNCIIGDNVRIENNVIVGNNSVIGNGSILKDGCKILDNTVIGSKNKIGFCAEITGVTMEGVCAVHNCEIFGVIGKFVDIAAGVQMAVLKFNDTLVVQKVNGKKYESKYTNSVLIGNYTRTGIANLFYPGIKVGSRSALGPGLIVDQDIKENSLVLLESQKKIMKPWGSNRYGW